MSKKDLSGWLLPPEVQQCYFVDESGVSTPVLFSEEQLPDFTIFFAATGQHEGIRLRELCDTPLLSLYFSLAGETSALSNGDLLRLSGQQHLVSYKPSYDGYYNFDSSYVRNFGVIIKQSFFGRLHMDDLDCLKRFWDKVNANQMADISPSPMNITAQQLSLIHEIANCPFKGRMRESYMESKVVELFLYQAAQAESLKGMKAIAFSQSDVDRLHSAKHYIREHMFEPISLHEISRAAGLNEFKLKKGFREVFGTTAFGYLNELRMAYARQLILNSDCSILEAAYSVGYAEPYSFTRAFRKYFGYLPSELKG